jgi:uncharacterized protein
MPRIICDSTVLVSAFLVPQGTAAAVLAHVRTGRVTLAVSDTILAETARVLLTSPHIRQRYQYPDTAVQAFCDGLTQVGEWMTDVPPLRGVCRDPNDDMVLACALATGAPYLVTRDKDVLVLQQYEAVTMITPEAFLAFLRANPH